jgi:hypothetical protein
MKKHEVIELIIENQRLKLFISLDKAKAILTLEIEQTIIIILCPMGLNILILNISQIGVILFSDVPDYFVMVPEEKEIFDRMIVRDVERRLEDEFFTGVVEYL